MVKNSSNNDIKSSILDIISIIIVNMIVIIMATKIFRDIYIDGLLYTFIVATFLMILNKLIKPLLNLIMLPLNIVTLGITYPFITVIILKIISLFMGSHFIINGWFTAFFISIFISIMTIIIDSLIGKEIRKI